MSSGNEHLASPWWRRNIPWLGFGLVAIIFVVIKSFALHWQVGDENVYFYMASAALKHGAWPYGDFFFAHPPLHLLPGIGLFALAGFSSWTARFLPVLASLVGAGFLFRLIWERAGAWAAWLSVFFYLGAFSLLRASSHWTGINLAVMWICLGLWALLGKKSRPLLSGVFFALGVGTGNYVLPGMLMAGMLAVLKSPRDGLRFASGFFLPWILIQGFGFLLGGGGYFDGVYRYHFLKPVKAGVSRDMFVRVFSDNFALFLGLCLAPLLAWLDARLARKSAWGRVEVASGPRSGPVWRRFWLWWRERLWMERELSLLRIGALWSLGTILFIASLPRVFPFYFLLFFPSMAWCAGVVLHRLVGHMVGMWRGRRSRDKQWWEAAVILSLFVLAVLAANLVRVPVQRLLLPSYVRGRDTPMTWSDSPLPWVGSVMRKCCWDDVAEAYRAYGTLQEVLFHESRYLEVAEEIAAYVRAHSRPEQTLFGDSSTAGLVALLAERRIAAHEVDTNTMRFTSGITSPDALIARLAGEDLKFVLVSGRISPTRDGRVGWRFGKFASLPAFAAWLRRDFKVARQFKDKTKGWYTLLVKKDAP